MRAIFADTRTTLARRVVAVVGGLDFSPTVTVAVHGWVAFVEECVIQWIATGTISRSGLLDLLTRALPGLLLAAADDQRETLVELLTAPRTVTPR
jgi:hypothetical protein